MRGSNPPGGGGNPPGGFDPLMDRDKQMSSNNLKMIALAMHNFNAPYRPLPLPGGDGRNGPGKLSWRVALLPFLEQGNLYQQFKLNEPWDSPHNRTLLTRMPPVYAPVRGAG